MNCKKAIDAMSSYYDKWILRINVAKTKVVAFSRGKIKKLPFLQYKGQDVEVIFCFNL